MRGNKNVADKEMDKIAAARANQQVQTGQFLDLLTNPTFRRPFITSLALRILGLDWSGFFNLGTNLVHIKQQVMIQTPLLKMLISMFYAVAHVFTG